MADNINPNSGFKITPESRGGFTPNRDIVGGRYQQSSGLPFAGGKSVVASIPEYAYNPLKFEQSMMTKIEEGRANFTRTLLEIAGTNGGVKSVLKPNYEYEVLVAPIPRLYIAIGTYAVVDNKTTLQLTNSGIDTLRVAGKTIKTAFNNGSPNQSGDVSQLEVGQYILLMCSLVKLARTTVPAYKVNGVKPINKAVPEICKIESINADKGTIVVSRNWAGDARLTTPAAPASFTVGSTGSDVKPSDAFVIAMSKALGEDELTGTIRSVSGTFDSGQLQMDSSAYGSRHMAEVVAANLGQESFYSKTKKEALRLIMQRREYTALFGMKSSKFNSMTNLWEGSTDGLLSKIPDSNQIAILGVNYSVITNGNPAEMGAFQPAIFNKFLSDKNYIGSSTRKIIVCGQTFADDFMMMMQQISGQVTRVQNIVSEWKVVGTRFTASNGMLVDVVPSDQLTMNGMEDLAVIMDPGYFHMTTLKGYSTLDALEMPETHPYQKDGYFHSCFGFNNTLPEAHWIIKVVPNTIGNREIVAATGTPLKDIAD